MPPLPDRRFVRHSLADAPGTSATITLLAAAPNAPLEGAADAALNAVAQVDPARAERIRARIVPLLAYEDALFKWLERDPANGLAFIHDPCVAIRVALPDLAEDMFD